MSELPIEAELIRFAARIISQARRSGQPGSEAARKAAGQVLSDREDKAVSAVLAAAYKVAREIDRMRGLLRFSLNARGVYTARCAPDYGVLPALAGHFIRRFGETPWLIIDEKRSLRLFRAPGQEPRLCYVPVGQSKDAAGDPADREGPADQGPPDPWEELWRIYHRTVNIESRTNPRLQRQWLPARYWKYLSEMG
jgi:probable DNA metabolism protein